MRPNTLRQLLDEGKPSVGTPYQTRQTYHGHMANLACTHTHITWARLIGKVPYETLPHLCRDLCFRCKTDSCSHVTGLSPQVGTHIMGTWPTHIELAGNSGKFDYVEFVSEHQGC